MEIKKIWFDDTNIFVETTNNKVGQMPLEWFPGFQNATKTELENYELWSDNSWIHWEKLNEDLSVEGFFTFKKEQEFA